MQGQSKLSQGLKAESDALKWFLAAFPAKLIGRNYRTKMGEIDLIFEQKIGSRTELVFVEVRERLAGSWVSGVESVGYRKQQRLRRAISYFLARYRGNADSVRLDILARGVDGWTHLQNVWELR